MKTITVEVLADGTIKVDVLGYKGQGCAKLTADLERALGQPTAKGKKPEWYQAQEQGQKAGQG